MTSVGKYNVLCSDTKERTRLSEWANGTQWDQAAVGPLHRRKLGEDETNRGGKGIRCYCFLSLAFSRLFLYPEEVSAFLWNVRNQTRRRHIPKHNIIHSTCYMFRNEEAVRTVLGSGTRGHHDCVTEAMRYKMSNYCNFYTKLVTSFSPGIT